jgi:uncharacterized protein YlxW (UPF0749 family)
VAQRWGHKTWAAAVLAAVAVLVGFLVVVQARSAGQVRPPAPPVRRAEELAALAAQAEAHRAALEAELARLRAQLAEYERLTAEGRALSAALLAEIRHYRQVLGLDPVRGPGLEVVLVPGTVPGLPLSAAVQALDLAGLVNELWASGAEAVAVNGRRVLSRSSYRQSGNRVVVDGVPLRPPFVIQAIGPADSMEAALQVRGGFVDGLRAVGVTVRVGRRPELRLPPYRGPLEYRWARPDR